MKLIWVHRAHKLRLRPSFLLKLGILRGIYTLLGFRRRILSINSGHVALIFGLNSYYRWVILKSDLSLCIDICNFLLFWGLGHGLGQESVILDLLNGLSFGAQFWNKSRDQRRFQICWHHGGVSWISIINDRQFGLRYRFGFYYGVWWLHRRSFRLKSIFNGRHFAQFIGRMLLRIKVIKSWTAQHNFWLFWSIYTHVLI